MDPKIFIHIVTWNNEDCICKCIYSLIDQRDKVCGTDFLLRITDNNSSDGTIDILQKSFKEEFSTGRISFEKSYKNLGFVGGHNLGASKFLLSDCTLFLILNPDTVLDPYFLKTIDGEIRITDSPFKLGAYTPKLLRSDEMMNPRVPHVIDAAGMILTSSLRHLDRGSGEEDKGQYNQKEHVFGGTGACLILTRECVQSISLPHDKENEAAVWSIYPALEAGYFDRLQLFDEAFFAYREDADLAWRMKNLGYGCMYLPKAVVYHRRTNTPEKRKEMSSQVNSSSVRNRFLLQLNNFTLREGISTVISGLLLRNFIVVLGVLLSEQSSFKGLMEVFILFKRALKRRRILHERKMNDKSIQK